MRGEDRMQEDGRVAVAHHAGAVYPELPPFHPATAYPEYPFAPDAVSLEPNDAYALVRESLRLLGLDAARFGMREWNPLGAYIRPGDTVVLKPNWVVHEHRAGGSLDSVITHSSIIRAAADYVWIALKGTGRILVADAPLPSADFGALQDRTGMAEMAAFLVREGVPLEVRDLRRVLHVYTADDILGSSSRVPLAGDLEGYATVDLGGDSEFAPLGDPSGLYGADYDRQETIRHHLRDRHEYLIARTVLKADVIVGLPKMKVHRKVGATLNLKNLVGINGDKNYLPHFQIGAPSRGGDEFPDSIGSAAKTVYALRRRMVDRLLTSGNPALEKAYVLARRGYHVLKHPLGMSREVIQAGDWYGNDTAWRMVLDLNKILHYATPDGQMTHRVQRRFFSVLDGVVAGEGEGPLVPDSKRCGLVLAGANPLATDLAALRMMGLDWSRLRLYRRAVALEKRLLLEGGVAAVRLVSGDPDLIRRSTSASDRLFALRPPRGWLGNCEFGGAGEVRAG